MKTILTLAVLSLIAVAGSRADVITKGASSTHWRNANVSSTPAAEMACPKCKSEFVTRTEFATKGTAGSTSTVERHLCPGCKTAFVTVGGGKAKAEVAKHACGGCNS